MFFLKVNYSFKLTRLTQVSS